VADLKTLKDLIALTRARDGAITLSSIALATGQEITLQITRDNIMGTKIFHAQHPQVQRDLLSRGYNPAGISSRIEGLCGARRTIIGQDARHCASGA
jgi:hypothetical protein